MDRSQADGQVEASCLQHVNPSCHKEAAGTPHLLPRLSLFFITISVLLEVKPGRPHNTLRPKLVKPDVAPQDTM